MLSLTKPHHYYQTFLSQGVGMGLGMGIIFTPVLSIPSHYFRRRRPIAMGCVVAGKPYTTTYTIVHWSIHSKEDHLVASFGPSYSITSWTILRALLGVSGKLAAFLLPVPLLTCRYLGRMASSRCCSCLLRYSPWKRDCQLVDRVLMLRKCPSYFCSRMFRICLRSLGTQYIILL